MRNHRTTTELESIIGRNRLQYTDRVVASAERELLLRGEREEALFQRKLSRSGAISAVIGGFCIVWPALMLVAFSNADHAFPSSVDPTEPFVFRNFGLLFTVVGVLQLACGVLLLVGGIALRRRNRIGPMVTMIPIVLAMTYVVGFNVLLFPGGMLSSAPLPVSFIFLAFSMVWSAFLVFLLWIPLRFFASPRVREACCERTA